MPKFCAACKSVLTKETSTNYVTMICHRCSKTYDGGPEDSLIISNFNPTSDIDTSMVLALSAFDRVNKIEKMDCPCGRKYMTQVAIDGVVSYTCDNCDIILRGDQRPVKN